MKRTLLAALAATLSTGALALSGDAWYGTNRYDPAARAELDAPMQRDSTILYTDRDVTPIYIERRDYIVSEPRDVVLYPAPAETYYYYTFATEPAFDPLHPQQGQLVGRGLFNRTGPNDFGQ